MNYNMLEDFFLPVIAIVSVFGTFFGLVWFFIRTRNHERMAMIEKGVDPSLFIPKPAPMRLLRFALFFMGTGLGLLAGDLLTKHTVLNPVTSYFSMILVFAGLGIYLGSRLASKQER